MRAWTILTFFILFNVSFGVVSALEIGRGPASSNLLEEADNPDKSDDFIDQLALSDESGPSYLKLIGLGGLVAAIAGAVFLNLPAGATVYAAFMGLNLFSLDVIIENIEDYAAGFTVMPELKLMLSLALTLVFLWGFIDLAS